MKLDVENWGQVDGQAMPVKLFTLENSQGMKVQLTNFGCIVTSIETPDREGNKADVVLGYETLDKYLAGHPFFGAVAGRFANRVKDGRYELDGEVFQLDTNEQSRTHLHGGIRGFDKYVWNYAVEQQPEAVYIHLSRTSPDGEAGYGGTMDVTHTIGLDELNQIHYNFKATTDKPTVVNLVNHGYYNLGGHDSGSVDSHHLTLFSQFYTPVTEDMIPTGEVLSVKGTGLDFRSSTVIGHNKKKVLDGAYDHNFILDQSNSEGEYHYAAELYDPKSGRVMTVLTTQPAVQFYNASKLSNNTWLGRNGHQYQSFEGVCLETQHFPDSPNQPHFPSVRLDPGDVFEEKTLHRFSVK